MVGSVTSCGKTSSNILAIRPTILTSDDDITQWIGLPGGLSISGIAYIWNRWRPWREKFSRQPSLVQSSGSVPQLP
jgi:hypothetical protein